LSEALPIYSGGLGNVAGDQLKAASDLGVPVIGVGLLYSQGYFRQFIDRDGAQQAVFPYNDPGQLPITPLRRPNGEWLRLILDLSGRAVWLRAWQVRVGRLALYLLDSNDAANAPMARIAGARPTESGRFCGGLQYGVSGDPRGALNGVSRLHGDVSRHLFAPLFARWPIDGVPVGYVTNGVHMPTWDSAAADELWTDACGKGRWLGTTEALEQLIRGVPDEQLWRLRSAARRSLVEFVRGRLSRQLEASGASRESVAAASHVFDPDALTLGFARRFAMYKRPNLLLHDPERLLRLLNDRERPMQLVLAGKAHPADTPGPGANTGVDAFHRTVGRRARSRRLPQRLRHAAHRAAGARRRCVAQHAATAVGSQRNERHEGTRQRWHQSVGTGRVVGGSLHAGSRVGAG
jgi:glucan phosphorylase